MYHSGEIHDGVTNGFAGIELSASAVRLGNHVAMIPRSVRARAPAARSRMTKAERKSMRSLRGSVVVT